MAWVGLANLIVGLGRLLADAWRSLRRRAPPPSDLPYDIVRPDRLLSQLPSLGPHMVEYVPREDTRYLREHPLPNRPLLFEGRSAVGKTREAAEIALSIARQHPSRAAIYLYKAGRLEIPDPPPPDLPQRLPILFFDDVDHPWRIPERADCEKAASTFRRIAEIAEWFRLRSHDRETCWVVATARNEPLDRVWRNPACQETLNVFHRVRLGPLPRSEGVAYWKEVCRAVEVRPNDELITALVKVWAGGLREAYDYLAVLRSAGRKALRDSDVAEFGRFQQLRWGETVSRMPAEQRDLLRAMSDLDSVGVPLFRELVLGLALTRRVGPGRFGRVVGLWDRSVLRANLDSMARGFFPISEGDHLLPHGSRLLEVDGSRRTEVGVEVVHFLVRRALARDLSPPEVAHLRDALAGADGNLYGSDLLRDRYLVNRTRGALSLPRRNQQMARVKEAVAQTEGLADLLTALDGPQWAAWQNTLGVAYGELPTGDRAENLRQAIACCQAALRVRTEEAFPAQWAATQNNLGNAYCVLPTGDRAENLRQAITCYQAALRVSTEEVFPVDWAATHNNLGNAYKELPMGDRAENLRQAIACYQAALRVRTEEAFPVDWATTQNNLGNAYCVLPTGDRAQNLRQAIACYQAALRVYTEQAFPGDWAQTQNNLGNAYADLPTGDRAENLRRAVACYETALRVHTEAAFPVDWAGTQNNLGTAYAQLPTGDRAENLRRAIACFEAALRIYTEAAFPVDRAMTQNNLGNAYQHLPTGDRGENLRQATECYRAALRVYTEEAFPPDWAMTQNNLGIACSALPTGDRGENLRRAIRCYHAALRVRTEAALPADWAGTQNNLGLAYASLPTGDRAENLRQAIRCYEAALRVHTEEAFPEASALVQRNLERARRKLDELSRVP